MTASEDPRLAQIRDLCDWSDKWNSPGDGNIPVHDLRAILDTPPVDATPPQGIDRESLWSTLSLIHALWPVHDPDLWTRRILAVLPVAQAPIIDRHALKHGLIDVIDGEWEGGESDGQIADRMIEVFLALVRPAEGVTLTPEEVEMAADALRHSTDAEGWNTPAMRALAARLEVLSRRWVPEECGTGG